jgi:excisionase family DNA binding protein
MTVDQQTVETFLADFAAEVARRTATELQATFPDPERLLTVEEAAAIANVTPRHIRNLISHKNGELPRMASVKVGDATRIFQADLRAYLASRRVAPREDTP